MLILAAFWGNAAVYHVSPAGNDANSGRSEKEAWRTFSRKLPVEPGDTVVLHGVFLPAEQRNPKKPEASFTIQTGGSASAPVTYRGAAGSAIYGTNNNNALLLRGVRNIRLENLSVRNGTLMLFQTANIKIRNSTLTGQRAEIHVRYSVHVEIHKNAVLAERASALTLGSGRDISAHHNTLICRNGNGITVIDKNTDTLRIENNIVTKSRLGICKTADSRVKNENIRGNILWQNAKKIQWLQQVETRKAGMDHWRGFDSVPENNPVADPEIISFDPADPDFFAVGPSSPAVEGRAGCGAAKPWKAPAGEPGVNLLANPDFLNGMYGWSAGTWQPFEFGAFRSEIVKENGKTFLRIVNNPSGNHQAKISSRGVRISRGHPVEIRFRAKADRPMTLSAELNVRSGCAAKKHVRISTEWKEYSVKFQFKPFYPDLAGAAIGIPSRGTVCLTGIRMIQNPAPGAVSCAVMIEPVLPGMVCPAGTRMTLSVPDAPDSLLEYVMTDPSERVTDRGNGKSPLVFPLKGSGAQKLTVTVKTGNGIIARESYRMIVSEKPPRGRNSGFIGVNSPATLRGPRPLEQVRSAYAACSALGIGLFHLYLPVPMMRNLLWKAPYQWTVFEAEKAGIGVLMTFDDSALLTGKRNMRIPGPEDPDGTDAASVRNLDDRSKRLAPERLAVWKQYIGAIAEKYSGAVRFFEICNEPNCYLNTAEYAKILDETIPVIRKNAPRGVILGGSLVNAGKEMWNMTVKRRDIDQFSFHPYRFHDSNPHRSGLERMIRFAQSGCGGKPVHLTEEFREAGPDFPAEKDEANAYARILNLSLGLNAAAYHRHHNLFLDSACTPNLLGSVINTMMSLLSQAEPVELFSCGNGITAALYSVKSPSGTFRRRWNVRGPVSIAAVWRNDHQLPRSAPFPVDGVRFRNLYGNPAGAVLGRDLIYLLAENPDERMLKEKILRAAEKSF